MGKVFGLLFAVTLGLSCVLAQDRADVTAKPDVAAQAAAGQAVFQQNCSFCHGRDGRGASGGPDLIRSTLVNHDVDGDLIGPVVHNGRVDKGMPAFELPDEQIHQLAAFLHQQGKLASTVASRIPSEYPLEQLLIGNADAGKTYFNGAGKCVQCHSPTGNLAHIGSKYKPLELQSRIVFPDGAKSTASVTDSAGHRYTGEVLYSDEFFITLLSDGQPRTWERHAVQVAIKDPLAAQDEAIVVIDDEEEPEIEGDDADEDDDEPKPAKKRKSEDDDSDWIAKLAKTLKVPAVPEVDLEDEPEVEVEESTVPVPEPKAAAKRVEKEVPVAPAKKVPAKKASAPPPAPVKAAAPAKKAPPAAKTTPAPAAKKTAPAAKKAAKSVSRPAVNKAVSPAPAKGKPTPKKPLKKR